MRRRSLLLGAASCAPCLALWPTPATAHGWWPPKHGGLMNLGGEISFELVAADQGLTIHVEDHGIPVPTTGALGELTVSGPQGRRSVPIADAGDNRLQGPPLVLQDGERVRLSATLASGLYLVGYFIVGMPAPAPAAPSSAPMPRFAQPLWPRSSSAPKSAASSGRDSQ